jgi:kanamycin kinase
MESSSPTLRLPRVVRSAAQQAVGGEGLTKELAWMSWAGTVWRLAGPRGAIFVKRASELTAERDRLECLSGRWPVPEVIGFFHVVGDDWMLTREVQGRPMYEASTGWEPTRVARKFGQILKMLHSADATGCPFGVKRRGNVLVHGDYCLPNVLLSDGKLSGLVDVGRAGFGNPEVDLAAGVWTLQYNYGLGCAREFLDAYGWPPMTDTAIERLRRKYGR